MISEEAVEAVASGLYFDEGGAFNGNWAACLRAARVALETVGPQIAAKAWDEGYVKAVTGPINATNPYRSQA